MRTSLCPYTHQMYFIKDEEASDADNGQVPQMR
jgi:hypothetical protein